MERQKKLWIILILVAFIGIAGCSLAEDQSKKDQERLEEKADEFREISDEVKKTLKDYESNDLDVFEDEHMAALGEMEDVIDEFQELGERTEDRELRKDARLCHRGMVDIYNADFFYGASIQLYLEAKASENQEEMKERKMDLVIENRSYFKKREKGREMVQDSGL